MTHHNGFTSVPNWIIHDPTLTPTAKAVYLALASHANQEGRCWPGHQLLAAEVGCSVDTVQRALQGLRAAGAVAWTKRGAHNLYRVAVGQMRPLREAAPRPEEAAPMRHEETAPMRLKQDSVEQDSLEPPAATASEAAPILALVASAEEPEPVLFTSDDLQDHATPQAERPPNGSDLFKAWCDGYQAEQGHPPDAAVYGRLRGQVREVTKSRTDHESWRRAWRAFHAAGRRGDFNVLSELLGSQSRFTPRSSNVHATAASLALLDEMMHPERRRPATGGTR